MWGLVWNIILSDIGEEWYILLILFELCFEFEIVFGMKFLFEVGMSEIEFVECIDWVLYGFEVVFLFFLGWCFFDVDCVVVFGLYGVFYFGLRLILM